MTTLEEANETASQLYATFCESQNNRNMLVTVLLLTLAAMAVLCKH